jgi:predicted RNA binding protein YcfA (HicA-like mRNA interferase family)
MSRLPTLTPRQVLAALKRAGFVEYHRHTSGSHLSLQHPQRKSITTIAMHKKDLPRGTLSAIIKQAGLTEDEFRRLL